MKKIIAFLCPAIVLSFCLISFGQKKPVAADFTSVGMNGQTISLASLKGKVVVLTFWSTRCGICVHEIPKLNQLVRNYKDQNVVFLGLTMENSAKVQKFIKSKPFNFNLLPDSFGIVLKYADKSGSGFVNMGFPSHFIINQKGEIELKTSGFDKTEVLNSQITRLLATGASKSRSSEK